MMTGIGNTNSGRNILPYSKPIQQPPLKDTQRKASSTWTFWGLGDLLLLVPLGVVVSLATAYLLGGRGSNGAESESKSVGNQEMTEFSKNSVRGRVHTSGTPLLSVNSLDGELSTSGGEQVNFQMRSVGVPIAYFGRSTLEVKDLECTKSATHLREKNEEAPSTVLNIAVNRLLYKEIFLSTLFDFDDPVVVRVETPRWLKSSLEQDIIWTETGTGITDVDVGEDYVFVSNAGEGGFRIYYDNHMQVPELKGSYKTQNLKTTTHVRKSGNLLFVTGFSYSNTHGFSIFNIDNPESPTPIAFYELSTQLGLKITDIKIAGNFVYVKLDRVGYEIVDVSTPKNPKFVSNYFGRAGVKCIGLSKDLLYVGDVFGLKINGNASIPATLTLKGHYHPLGFSPRDIAVAGQYAYVVDHRGHLTIINASRPESPTLVGSHGDLGRGLSVKVSGAYVYVFGHRRLTIFDVRNVAKSKIVRSWSPSDPVVGVAVSDKNYVYLAFKDSKIHILNTRIGNFRLNGKTNEEGTYYVRVIANDGKSNRSKILEIKVGKQSAPQFSVVLPDVIAFVASKFLNLPLRDKMGLGIAIFRLGFYLIFGVYMAREIQIRDIVVYPGDLI